MSLKYFIPPENEILFPDNKEKSFFQHYTQIFFPYVVDRKLVLSKEIDISYNNFYFWLLGQDICDSVWIESEDVYHYRLFDEKIPDSVKDELILNILPGGFEFHTSIISSADKGIIFIEITLEEAIEIYMFYNGRNFVC